MIKVYNYQKEEEEGKSKTDRNLPVYPNNIKLSNAKSKYKNKFIVVASIIFGLICILIIVLLFAYKPWKKNNNTISNPSFNETIIQSELNYEEFKNELIFTTKVNDLRRISINQTSYENMTIDGIESTMELYRITNYDIYILSEKEAEERDNHLYGSVFYAKP